MTDSALPPSLDGELRALRSRLERLEMSARTTGGVSSTLKEGTFSVKDAAGVTVAELGKVAGSYGIRILTSEGVEVFRALSSGGMKPAASVSMYGSNNALTPPAAFSGQGNHAHWTDQGVFTEMWRGFFTAVGPTLSGSVFPWALPAHTLEWQVHVCEVGGVFQNIASGTTSITGPSTPWTGTIPASALVSGVDPRGRACSLSIRLRRTVGGDRVGLGLISSPLNT